MAKATNRSLQRDEAAQIVAEIHGVSARYVRMVRNGDREDEEIMATLVEYQLGKSNLIKTLEALVPLNPNPEKYARKKD